VRRHRKVVPIRAPEDVPQFTQWQPKCCAASKPVTCGGECYRPKQRRPFDLLSRPWTHARRTGPKCLSEEKAGQMLPSS
jgi:hypothetical protein